jgi:flagellar basal-body rod protein FlgC
MVGITGFGAAVSGLRVAQTQLQVSANNVANVRSIAAPSLDSPAQDAAGRNLFVPRQTAIQAQEFGGATASTVPVDPPSVRRVEPDAVDADAEGLVNRPNVSLDQEIVTQIRARAAFEANLATIETADEMAESLLDIRE